MPDSSGPLLDRCHHPLVRDLAWLLTAPDLIATPWPGRPGLAELGFRDARRLAAWLEALEADPAELEARVGDTLQGRMGLYHERLWQFLLDAAPATRLVGHNLRIQQGTRTLGELDLLYCRESNPLPVHLEVALKYYLGLPEGPGAARDQARWIGPGGADSLAGKREHLHRRQLRLGELPEAREAIRALLTPDAVGADRPLSLSPRMAMPGVLFYPWRERLPPPREATADHLRGLWLPWGAWGRYRHGLPRGTRGAWLHKPHWLALPRPEALIPLAELEARLVAHFRTPAAPLQLALLAPGGAWQRLFLVADDWPRRIPLPPYP